MTLGEICAVQLNVVNLGDDELERVAVILDEARVRVRAELGERKRKRRDDGLMQRVAGRTSCVFCRRVYTADRIGGHILAEHRRELAARPRIRVRAR